MVISGMDNIAVILYTLMTGIMFGYMFFAVVAGGVNYSELTKILIINAILSLFWWITLWFIVVDMNKKNDRKENR